MNLENLEYFLVAAEEKNITRAAERLYISQQSLSSHILRLERHYGVTLFERRPTLMLTEAGRKLQKAARQMLNIEKELAHALDDINHQRHVELRIGIPYTRGRILLPEILPGFQKKHPQIELHITEGHTAALCEWIRNGQIDLLIAPSPILEPTVQTISLMEERLFMCVPHELLRKHYPEQVPSVLSLAEFADTPMLLMAPGNQLRRQMDSIFIQHHIQPNILLETGNIETLISLCEKGLGITFYPEMFVRYRLSQEHPQPLPVHFSLFQEHTVPSSLIIGYRLGNYVSYGMQTFIDVVRDYFSPGYRNDVLPLF